MAQLKDLIVNGPSRFVGNITANDSFTLGGPLIASGDIFAQNTLFIGGNSDGISLTATSIDWHNPDNINQGNLLSFSSSDITSHKSIYPNSNNLSLGSSGSKWNNIYTQNANIASLNVSSSLTIGGVTLTASNGILTISGLVLALNGLTSATALSESSGTGSLIFTGPWSDYTSEKSDYALAASLGYDLHTRVTSLESKATNVKFTQVIAAGKQIGTISIDGKATNLYAPSTYAWSEVEGKPTFAPVATSGSYNDLSNKPTIATLMGTTAIGSASAYAYWNGTSWVSKTLGSAAFLNSTGTFTSIQHTDYPNNQGQLTSRSFISYWNGAYDSSGDSNLAYCKHGAFGNIVTKSISDFAAAGHTHAYLPLAGGDMTNNAVISGSNLRINGNRNNLYIGNEGNDANVCIVEDLCGPSVDSENWYIYTTGEASFNKLSVGGTSVSLDGHTHTFSSLTSKPTTISGYGITDAYTKTEVDTIASTHLHSEQVSVEQNTSKITWIKDYALTHLRGHVYNIHGLEWQYLFGMSTTKTHGNIIRATYGDGSPRIQIMGLNNGAWSGWREVLTDLNYSSYALPLSGGTMTGNLNFNSGLSIKSANTPVLEMFSGVNTYLRSNNAIYLVTPNLYQNTDGKFYTLIHSGSIGSQSVSHATTTNRFKLLFGSEPNTVDLNTALSGGGMLSDFYGGISRHANAPLEASFGSVIEFSSGRTGGSLSGQLAWDINYKGTQATRALYWRAGYDEAWTNSNWKTIAFTDSNVASADYATKAGKAQYLISSDGTMGLQVLSGGIINPSNRIAFDANTTGICRGSYYTSALSASDIVIAAPKMVFYEGNVGIGTTSPETKLHVDGGRIRCDYSIFGYRYKTNINAAAFIWNKPGSYYTGVGSDGTTDTIRFSACNADGTWVSYTQNWKFYGNIVTTGNFTASGNASVNGTLGVSGRATLSGGITSKADHDFMAHVNEFNFIPDSYSGSININWRTASGSLNGNVEEYRFLNGTNSYTDIRCKNLYATGNTLQIGSATLTWNGSALVVDKPLVSTSFAAGATATASSGGSGSYGPVRINVTALCGNATNVPQSTLDSYGLTATVIENMADGLYTKVIDTQNRASWTYEASIDGAQKSVWIRRGDGFDIKDGISMLSNNSGSTWRIIFGEI